MTKRQKIQKTPKTPVELQALNDMLYEKLNKLEDKCVNLQNENSELIERIRKMGFNWSVEARDLKEKSKCLTEQAEEQEFSITVLNEGTGVGTCGTHRNFKNLGTDGYRVPGKF